MSVKIASLYAEISANNKPLNTALTQSKSSINSFGSTAKKTFGDIAASFAIGFAGIAVGINVIKKAFDEVINTFVEYANEVRTISQVTGESAESVSRLLQVTDDYKISSQSLTVVMKKMATEGFAFTTDSLAKLSDEYLKLNPGVERQIFLNDKFGRQGVEFAEIMLAGGDAIRSQSDAISENLILTDRALREARDYEKAVDSLNDALEGLKIALGKELIPVFTFYATLLETVITDTKDVTSVTELLGIFLGKLSGMGWGNMPQQIDAVGDSIEGVGDAASDAASQLAGLKAEFDFTISFASQYQSNLKNVTEANDDLNVAQKELFDLIKAGWPPSSQKIKDAEEKVGDLKTRLREAEQASQDATNEMIAGFLQAQLTADGSFTQEDIQKVLDYRFSVGLLTQEAYDAAQEALRIANNLAGIPNEVKIDIYEYRHVVTSFEEQQKSRDSGQGNRRAGGGSFSGWAMVGDSKGGGMTPYTEWVYAPHGATVFNQSQMSGRSAPPMAGGGVIPPMDFGSEVNLSDKSIRDLSDALFYKLQAVM
jgi:hypothetical protein